MKRPDQRLDTAHQVDTSQPIPFFFDGQPYKGFAGDTVASALLANGIKIVGRSFKLHRPRGVMTAGCEEPNALLQVERGSVTEPNVRAPLLALQRGIRAHGQNAWPHVGLDIFGVLNVFQRMLPASFYYKSLMWPSWHVYEGLVRRLAGLGKAPREPGLDRYHIRHAHCDVLICGGGAAGIMAALAAGRSGVRVLLIDQQNRLGGALLGERVRIDGEPAGVWLARSRDELAALKNVTVLLDTTVTAYYEHNYLTAAEIFGAAGQGAVRERQWRIRAREVILATGAIERPLVFANNDRPGVMLASAVREYANRFGVAAGKAVIVATNNDSAYGCALDLRAAGVDVVGVVDSRNMTIDGPVQRAANQAGIKVYSGCGIADVIGTRAVKGVLIAKHLGGGELGVVTEKIRCDTVAISGGWNPTVHLHSQSGGKLEYEADRLCFVPAHSPQGAISAGAANGTFALGRCLGEGLSAANTVLSRLGAVCPDVTLPVVDEGAELPAEPFWYTTSASTDKQWVDFQYDVKVSDLELAKRENFVSVEHVKRYTTNGMCLDQGKTSNVNALAVMSELLRKPIPEVGTTKFRPPYHPTTIAAYGGLNTGKRYAPRRYMPAHAWHVTNGARIEDYGGWERPAYYLQSGESEAEAVRREVLAVRNGVGLLEASPLGKIEVVGPDAATFLNRIYINNITTLAVGKARYGLITNENGIVIDDGVVVRLAQNHFLLHTTSSGATRIGQWLEEWLQCEWPNLQVMVADATSQWANVTVAGPRARDLVARLDSDIDFSRDAFPHMAFRTGKIGGAAARVLRASFSGEVSFEINVPARFGLSLWTVLMDAGADLGVAPYGVESLMVMRIEKGLLHVGADTDGNTTPLDLGWGGAIARKSDDFIGRRSLLRPADQRDDRRQFVGIEPVDPGVPLPVGGHVISAGCTRMPVDSQGYVTSACASPTLGRHIGLGIVRGGRQRIGERVDVFANGNSVAARLVAPTFYDPAGDRIND